MNKTNLLQMALCASLGVALHAQAQSTRAPNTITLLPTPIQAPAQDTTPVWQATQEVVDTALEQSDRALPSTPTQAMDPEPPRRTFFTGTAALNPDIYVWTDRAGQRHYSDDPKAVPRNAIKKTLPPLGSVSAPAQTASDAPAPIATGDGPPPGINQDPTPPPAAPAPASTTIMVWTDAHGVRHASNDPSLAPPNAQAKVFPNDPPPSQP